MNTLRMTRVGRLAVGLLLIAGCSDAQQKQWDWFGLASKDRKATPSDATKTASASRTAPGDPAQPAKDDPQARELDDRIDRYVKSMPARYDPTYEGNDFQSKIRRQSDPDRQERIRQAALLTRDASAPTESTPPPEPAESAPLEPEALGGAKASPAKSVAQPHQPESDGPLALQAPKRNRPTPVESGASAPKKTASAGETESPANKPPAQSPPVLESVKVTAEPEPAPAPAEVVRKASEPIKPNTPPAPSAPAVDTFKEKLATLEARVAKDPGNVEDQFKLRMLYLLDGRDEKALAPIKGADADTQEIVIAHVRALLASRGASQSDPAAWANKQLEALETLRGLVRGKADLRVPSLYICSDIQGFGRYTPIEPLEFKAGEPHTVLVYIEVDNFSTAKTSTGMYRTLLAVRQSLLNKAGEELWSDKGENVEDLSLQQRRDFFLTIGPIQIPRTLSPGEYVLKMEVEDMLAGKINGKSATFRMIAEPAGAPTAHAPGQDHQ